MTKPNRTDVPALLRHRICTICYARPEGSEALPPTEPRSCEPQCQIFINLDQLREIAKSVEAPTTGPYEHAMQEMICQDCQAVPTAGDYCTDRSTRACPLSRYAGDVVEILETYDAK